MDFLLNGQTDRLDRFNRSIRQRQIKASYLVSFNHSGEEQTAFADRFIRQVIQAESRYHSQTDSSDRPIRQMSLRQTDRPIHPVNQGTSE
jgi:hypothetical protein